MREMRRRVLGAVGLLVSAVGIVGCVGDAPAEAPPAPAVEVARTYRELESWFAYQVGHGDHVATVEIVLGWHASPVRHAAIEATLANRRPAIDAACVGVLKSQPAGVFTSLPGTESVREALTQAVAEVADCRDAEFVTLWRRVLVQ